jgi:hypothetical protein
MRWWRRPIVYGSCFLIVRKRCWGRERFHIFAAKDSSGALLMINSFVAGLYSGPQERSAASK